MPHVWMMWMDPIFPRQFKPVDSYVEVGFFLPLQCLTSSQKLRRESRSMLLILKCWSFPFAGKSAAVEETERGDKQSQEASMRIHGKSLLDFWIILSILSILEKKNFGFLLVYCVCSSRAIKSMGTINLWGILWPMLLFWPSSLLLNFKSYPHYCQMLLVAKKINAANHLLLTSELQVLPAGTTNKHFLHKAAVCFPWAWNGKCRQTLQTEIVLRTEEWEN